MLRRIRSLLADRSRPGEDVTGRERRQLHVAAASLLHEASRVDLAEHEAERAVAEAALGVLFGLAPDACREVLAEGADRARHLTSYYGPVSVLKRDLDAAGRRALIEQLWRVACADGGLDPYEDHYVRKIGHLLHVSNTEIVLARNHARGGGR